MTKYYSEKMYPSGVALKAEMTGGLADGVFIVGFKTEPELKAWAKKKGIVYKEKEV